jgi:hypothetical protein
MLLPENIGQGKALDPARHRELVMHGLRTAISRVRLTCSTLEEISIQLRHKQVTTEQAISWLADAGLSDHLQIGPKAVQS